MEKSLYKTLFSGVVILISLCGLLIFFLAMSFDEAWLISHYQEMIDGRVFDYKMAPNSLTSGGVFTLLNTLLFKFFGSSLWIFRTVSFCSLLGILFFLLKWAKWEGNDKVAACIVLSVFLSTNGSIEFGAQAFADFFGIFFIILGLNIWRENKPNPGISELLFLGGCLGVAGAVRLNLLFIFPAVLLEIFLFTNPVRKKLTEGILVLLSGIILFFLSQYLVIYFSPEGATELLDYSAEFVGLNVMWLDYARMFNRWVVGNEFMPFYLMTAISLFAWFDRSPLLRILRILVFFGWIHWFAWILRSPIAHLRYLLPSLAAFGIVGGFGLAAIYRSVQLKKIFPAKEVVLLIACALVFQNSVSISRTLLFGDANILSWEWGRETPLQSFRWYRSLRNQEKMAAYLRSHYPKEQSIGALGLDLEIEMLSGLRVIPLTFYFNNWQPHILPKKLLVNPMLGTYIYLQPKLSVWMEKNLEIEAQFGGYILYNLIGNYPEEPEIFQYSHTPHPQFPHAKPAL